jgi:hypothetical protein
MKLPLHDPVARWLVIAAAVATVVAEIVATLIGQARRRRGLLGKLVPCSDDSARREPS